MSRSMHDRTELDQFIAQNNLFPARNAGYIAEKIPQASIVAVPLSNGETVDIQCLARIEATDAPTVLYFHDPALADTSKIPAIADGFAAFQINFIAAEYCSTISEQPCSFSELGRRADTVVTAIKQWLAAQNEKAALFLMGESIGGVIALSAAANNTERVKGLIIDSLICETAPFLAELTGTACGIEEKSGFGCLEMIKEYKSPTLFYHGAKDQLVSTRDAEALQSYSGARNKQFYIIPGGERGNLAAAGGRLYFETIKKLFDTVCGTNTWREKRRKFKAGLQ